MRYIRGDRYLHVPPRAVTVAIIARTSEVRRHHHRSCHGRSRLLPPLVPRADEAIAARAYGSHGCRGAHVSGCHSLASPGATACVPRCLSRRRKPSSTSGCRSHLTRLQPLPDSETLIPRGLGCFYRRPDLVRLNRMARLA
jgi:hypothetical protein